MDEGGDRCQGGARRGDRLLDAHGHPQGEDAALTLTLTLTLPLTLTLTLTLALTLTLTLALTATRSVPPPQVSAAANIHNLVRVFPDGMHTAYASPLISRIEPPGGPVLGGTVITVHGAGFDAGGVGDAASCSFVGALPDGVVRVRQCAGLG